MSTTGYKTKTGKPKLTHLQRLNNRLKGKSGLTHKPTHPNRTIFYHVTPKQVREAIAANKVFHLQAGGSSGFQVYIDPVALFGMAKIECTLQEMAGCLGLSQPTFLKRLETDKTVYAFRWNKDPKGYLRSGTLKDIIATGYEEGKMSLRRMLYTQAETKPMCLIFLCKNVLGMRDHTALDFTNPLTVQSSQAQDTQTQLAALPAEDLITIREILRRNAGKLIPMVQQRALEAQGGDGEVVDVVAEEAKGEEALEEKAS